MKDMEVSVMAKVDNTFVAGNTFTDENGKFNFRLLVLKEK